MCLFTNFSLLVQRKVTKESKTKGLAFSSTDEMIRPKVLKLVSKKFLTRTKKDNPDANASGLSF